MKERRKSQETSLEKEADLTSQSKDIKKQKNEQGL